MQMLNEYQDHLTTVSNMYGIELHLTVDWSRDRPGGAWEAGVYSVHQRKWKTRYLEQVSTKRNADLRLAVDAAVEEAKSRLPEMFKV